MQSIYGRDTGGAFVLRPVTDASFRDCVRAIYVGLFANEILPLRSGEVIRCFLLGRWADLPVSVSLASALIERIFDGIWLCICLLITMQFVRLPQAMVDGGMFLAGLVLVSGASWLSDVLQAGDSSPV